MVLKEMINKTQIFISLLLIYVASFHCTSNQAGRDYVKFNSDMSEFSTGSTIGINTYSSKYSLDNEVDSAALFNVAEEGHQIVIASNSIPKAEFIKTLEHTIHEWHLLKLITGRWIGTYNEDTDIRNLFHDDIKNVKIKKGYVLIIDNIQTEMDTNFILEFWNNWATSIVGSYHPFKIVAELAQIKKSDLMNHLGGGYLKYKRPAVISDKTKKVIVFRGIVFKIAGKNATITSARVASARPGNNVVFLDRTGATAGFGQITQVYHTNVKVSIKQGKIKRGYTAVVYK